MVELKVPAPAELEEQYKDELEEETGIFHWKDDNGNFIPVDRMSEKGIKRAIHVCDKSQENLHESMERKMRFYHDLMCAWQYREDKLNEQLEAIEKTPNERTKRLTKQKELIE